jgi:hypothetical protein
VTFKAAGVGHEHRIRPQDCGDRRDRRLLSGRRRPNGEPALILELAVVQTPTTPHFSIEASSRSQPLSLTAREAYVADGHDWFI